MSRLMTNERSSPPLLPRGPGAESAARVAIVMPINATLYRNSMRAISQYVNEARRWHVRVFDSFDLNPEPLLAWRPQAMLVRAAPQHLPVLQSAGVPMVSIGLDAPLPAVPNVIADDRQIGRVAAEHFLERRFRHLAFVGLQQQPWSRRRHDGFAKVAEEAGVDVADVYATEPRRLAKTLRPLPRPLGILACNDATGVRVLDACAVAGLRVPDDVAVLGIDNFEYECDLTDPPMSSVINPIDTIAYHAFRLLERRLNGEEVPIDTTLIPTPGVVTRRSTDTAAVVDPDVAVALAAIRRGLGDDNLSVADLARAAAVSRRTLEYRFRAVLGRSPLQEIQLARVGRAKELLARTDLEMSMIAERSGFATASRLAIVFRQVLGTTPSAYRRQFRSGR